MSDLAYTRAVQEWWLQQYDRGIIVNVVEIEHPSWANDPLIVCDLGTEFRFTDEKMLNKVAKPLSFSVDESQRDLSTNQEFVMTADSQDGAFHRRIKALDPAERCQTMTLIHREYLNTNPGAPIMQPVTRLAIYDISTNRDNITVSANAKSTPNSRVGSYYLVDIFRELRYL